MPESEDHDDPYPTTTTSLERQDQDDDCVGIATKAVIWSATKEPLPLEMGDQCPLDKGSRDKAAGHCAFSAAMTDLSKPGKQYR